MPILMTWLSKSTDLVEVVDQLLGKADPGPIRYLSSYDPEAQDGRGYSEWTLDQAKALRFESMASAMETWRAVPKCHPLRDDGKPNRPLTAFTVSFETVPE